MHDCQIFHLKPHTRASLNHAANDKSSTNKFNQHSFSWRKRYHPAQWHNTFWLLFDLGREFIRTTISIFHACFSDILFKPRFELKKHSLAIMQLDVPDTVTSSYKKAKPNKPNNQAYEQQKSWLLYAKPHGRLIASGSHQHSFQFLQGSLSVAELFSLKIQIKYSAKSPACAQEGEEMSQNAEKPSWGGSQAPPKAYTRNT